MGRDIRTEFQPGGVPEALPEKQDLELARQTALASRTEIRQAQFKIDQAVYARRMQKAHYIPEVGIQYLFFFTLHNPGISRPLCEFAGDFAQMGCLRLGL